MARMSAGTFVHRTATARIGTAAADRYHRAGRADAVALADLSRRIDAVRTSVMGH